MFLWRKAIHLVFYFSWAWYLGMFVLEYFIPGFVSNVFSLNSWLMIVVGMGTMCLIFPLSDQEEKTMSSYKGKGHQLSWPRLRWIYVSMSLCLIAIFSTWRQNQIEEKLQLSSTARLSPSAYAVVVINASPTHDYRETYTQLLKNNGYTQTRIASESGYPRMGGTVVLYNQADVVAGQEIAQILQASYGQVSTAPLDDEPHKIVVILGGRENP